jgi:hypothetical protein
MSRRWATTGSCVRIANGRSASPVVSRCCASVPLPAWRRCDELSRRVPAVAPRARCIARGSIGFAEKVGRLVDGDSEERGNRSGYGFGAHSPADASANARFSSSVHVW